jgi:PQQ-like domain
MLPVRTRRAYVGEIVRRTHARVAAAIAIVAWSSSQAVAAPRIPSADEGGAQRWVALYDGPGSDATDSATAIAVNRAGTRVYVTGESVDPVNLMDFATVAYVAGTGRRLWVARLHERLSTAYAIAVSPDDATVYVSGKVGYGNQPGFYGTVAYDAENGTQLWYSQFAGDENNLASRIVLSPDGARLFVTAPNPDSDGLERWATVAYDTSDGSQLWYTQYHGPAYWDWPHAIGVSPDGATVYVSGESENGQLDQDFATVAYDASDGSEVWVARYAGPTGWDRAFGLVVSSDGRKVYVTGDSAGYGYSIVMATLAYDASDGTALWLRRDSTSYKPVGIGLSADGRKVFVAGSNFATVAYGAAGGARLWNVQYSDGGSDAAYALAVSRDGAKVFVTGNRYLDGNTDAVTVSYDAQAGDELWRAIYDGPAHLGDGGTAVAAGPLNKTVYVAGSAVGYGRIADDYLTLAYEQ